MVWEIELNSEETDKNMKELESHGLDFEIVGDKIHVFHVGADESMKGLVDNPRKLSWRSATLEDVFFRLTGRSLAE